MPLPASTTTKEEPSEGPPTSFVNGQTFPFAYPDSSSSSKTHPFFFFLYFPSEQKNSRRRLSVPITMYQFDDQMEMDGFDRLPDSLILLIFNSVTDIKTLIRCRSVSKRFNSLVPETESLVLKVDCVISSESESGSIFLTILKSLLKSLHEIFHPKPSHQFLAKTRPNNSPTQILTQFHRIRSLAIELPSGDLKLEKGVTVKWRADFGKTLKSCVILGFRSPENAAARRGGGGEEDVAGGLKVRVVWSISALIAASARHFLLKEVVKEHGEMEEVVLRDREGEGTVVMDKEGLRECREEAEHVTDDRAWEMSRTVVPSVSMRMRHEPRLELSGGVVVEGATLVVIRASVNVKDGAEVDDAELAFGAFGGVHSETVQALLKSRSYLLEMNSF
ncbi:F-box protein [Tripterygium wilfordii]|uniref:F-box protein n=1 Tax=Tripterygium wilfordii TaxID=458696 RepID=A0A7J7D0Y3_TRIWF|nr:F-box protein At1g22220-like [Tripterygium wilfordii]KAF5739726.1 F-box protein [Tripterygium wilfordii]